MSRARAALMSGGIAWQVCLEVLVEDDIRERSSWDNELTEDDEKVISGMYKMYTGNRDQTTDTSWWPKQSTWQGSCMDMGYWTPQCEEWYMHQRQLVWSGDTCGAPKIADRWCNALQEWKLRKKFINCVQIESALVLSDETRRLEE
ncbi:hypothetical protein FIBSPDRAFT_948324 [Athelia psychrophila]|uniref:Uncharacterized protein n=1 Tax=Athelia psychrophila TaxID=1759441 RepID=A0A166QZY0_9AGAM|nr:hypothetical protein FIBSPDRAFT_948324 [Fibularhizoctonia sp. CBS 109695]